MVIIVQYYIFINMIEYNHGIVCILWKMKIKKKKEQRDIEEKDIYDISLY